MICAHFLLEILVNEGAAENGSFLEPLIFPRLILLSHDESGAKQGHSESSAMYHVFVMVRSRYNSPPFSEIIFG